MPKVITPQTMIEEQSQKVSNELSLMEKIIVGLNAYLSKDNIEQKTRVEEINVIGMVEIESCNEWLLNNIGIKDRIAEKVVESRRLNNKSIEGKGIREMIDLAGAFSEHQTIEMDSTGDKLRRFAGGNV